MEITFLGHSAFKLKGKGATVVTDPFDSSIGLKFPKLEADIVTISHSHPDHQGSQVDGDPFIITGPGEYEIRDVKLVGVASFHDEKEGKERGKNTIFNIKIDELYVCHLGDLGQTSLTSNQLEEIGQVDILLIPVGGVFTIDFSEAAKIAASLEPKIVIPMHYFDPALKTKLEEASKFLKEMGQEKLEPQPKLSISKDKLPEEIQVFLFEKKA